MGYPHFCVDYDRNGILVRKAKLDGALRNNIPKRLRHWLLHVALYPILPGHLGETRMSYFLSREYYWTRMASDVFPAVRSCQGFIRLWRTPVKHQKLIKLFPRTEPLEFVSMDLLRLLKKTVSGNTSILVTADRFSKITWCIPLQNTTTPTMAVAFLEYCVYACWAPWYIVLENEKQVMVKLFHCVCGTLKSRHYLVTPYHPQTDGQTERLKKPAVQRPQRYAAGHQKGRDQYLQPPANSYNMQAHRTTGTTHFDRLLTSHPPAVTVLETTD